MNPNSSNSSKGGGNTSPLPKTPKKQISPALRWCFTLNNYTEDDVSSIVPLLQTESEKWIIGFEVGDSGTKHIQGFLRFKTKKRPLTVFSSFVGIHWEKCKGSDQQNYDYCSKDGIFQSNGFPKPIKVINPDRVWEKQILNIINTEPDDRTIYWFWSREGNVGKTAFCKYLTVKHNALPLHGKGADVRNGICDWLKNKGETPKLVVFPIPRLPPDRAKLATLHQ